MAIHCLNNVSGVKLSKIEENEWMDQHWMTNVWMYECMKEWIIKYRVK